MTVESRLRNLCGDGLTDLHKPLKPGQHGGRNRLDIAFMIRLGPQIRLTRKEVERFTKITTIEPVGVRTLADLEAYVARCKAHFWGASRETRFLHWLIDREVDACHRVA